MLHDKQISNHIKAKSKANGVTNGGHFANLGYEFLPM
jgi:hypothetical protein